MSEIKRIASELHRKQELVKDYIEQLDKVQELKQQIKDLQAEIKAIIDADEEIASLKDDVKSLSKELKQAAKAFAKDKSFKPAIVVAYAKTSIKGDEAVDKVKDKGIAFSFLSEEIV